MTDPAAVIRELRPKLSEQMPLVCLGPVFTTEEADRLESLTVKTETAYDNFGALERLDGELARFFSEVGNEPDVSAAAAASIGSFVRQCLAGFDFETAWITVRASEANGSFATPRWHFDGNYFEPYTGWHKIVLTLKGPGTLFSSLPLDRLPGFLELMTVPHDLPDREKIIAAYVGEDGRTQARVREPYLYIVGVDHAAIHSEPTIDAQRLFMSLVPGSAEQIDELRENWKAKTSTYG